MIQQWNALLLRVALVTAGCLAVFPGCTKKSPPDAAVEISWKYVEGSSGFVAMPSSWVATTSIRDKDGRDWTVVPDMIVGESLGSDALAKGICLAERQKRWNDVSPVTVNPSPSQKMGKYEEYTFSPPDDNGQVMVQWGDSKAVLKRNGKEAPWAAVELKKGDRLEYEWESHNFVTFKTDLKSTDRHRVFQLGPVFYDASLPSAPSYLLVAESGAGGKSGEQWHAESFRFVPLTAEEIRRHVEDAGLSDIWRCHFLTLLWAQPRPVADAGRHVMEFFANTRYPKGLRMTAASSLLELRYAPARNALVTAALDPKTDPSLRSGIVSRLDRILEPKECSLVIGVAENASNPLQVRKAALVCLGRMGDQGKTAIRQFTRDKDLKETAAELVKGKKSL
jgi:hypothetical protein